MIKIIMHHNSSQLIDIKPSSRSMEGKLDEIIQELFDRGPDREPNEGAANEPNKRAADEPNKRAANEPNKRAADEPNKRAADEPNEPIDMDIEKMDNEADTSESVDEQNWVVCRLINLQLKEFFDDIYIPFYCFKQNEWKISKVLYDNEDALFYNELFFTLNDNMKFHEVFAKYIAMIEEIMTKDNQLYVFLKKWTDKTNVRWKANLNSQNSYLKSILIDRRYQIISPSYMTDLYCELGKQYRDNETLLNQH